MNQLKIALQHLIENEPTLPNNISIQVRLEDLDIEDTGGGYMMENYPDDETFIIGVDERSELNFQLTILSHEFRHVKQRYNGELEKLNPWMVRFKGETYAMWAYEYRELPHEADANEFEAAMSPKLIQLFGETVND